jgi:DNA primase
MPLINLIRVKEMVSFGAVLELLHWRHVRTEAGWQRGGCPIHQRGREHGDAFAVREGGWHCHSCGRHGDQLALWAEANGLDLFPAVLDLCKKLGVEVPYIPRAGRKPRKPRTREEAR